jgi:hypothetical protein
MAAPGFRVEWNGERITRKAQQNMVRQFDESSAFAAELASGFSPVRTGELRDGWQALDTFIYGNHVHGGFYNDVYYTKFVNNGTYKMAGQFMAQRAMDIAYRDLGKRVESNMVF